MCGYFLSARLIFLLFINMPGIHVKAFNPSFKNDNTYG